jgi:DNA-directed RNA polymerase
MKDDFEHSRGRWLDQEELRAKLTGWGTSRQGHAIRRKYRDQLAELLDADRRHPRNREIWVALKDVDPDVMLSNGITAAAADGIGVDETGIKKFRDQAIWLGQHLGLKRPQRDLEYKIGAWAINMLNGLPVFAREDGVLTLPLTPSLDQWLNAVVEHGIRNNAFFFPSAEPPEPWTQVRKGGLPPNAWQRVSLISGNRRHGESAVRKAIADGKMRPVLDAVNHLAQTAFGINKPILVFTLRREKPRIQKLSARVHALAREREARKLKWSERRELANLKSELTVWELDIEVAKILACRERFYVPLQIVFGGRINPLPFFNFTRPDHIRSLFLFDRGEPIGEDGLLYLKAHVAKIADGNKWSTVERPGNLDLAGRIAWTDDNLELLRKIGNAVLRGDDPAQWEWVLETISDPCQFIAACAELAQALEVGPSFKTRLPLMFDATCSGLQQMCAMLRAEEGKLVNLVPSNELADFYSLVGAVVWRKDPELRHFFKDGNPFDRKIVKRPGMTYGYGSKAGGWQKSKRGRPRPKGMTEQIVEILKERGQSTKDAHKLARAVYDVIEEQMPAAKTLRSFLEKIAKVCTKHNRVLRWGTPLGLPVVNAYYKPIIKPVSVKIEGKRRRNNLIVGETKDISSTAKTSITANFVHSSDACYLHAVANATAKEAIPLVTIHDCYGAIAPHARRSNEIVREQFVQLHENYNWLERALLSAKRVLPKSVHHKLPELPKRGDLDLSGVLQSFFAFK